VRAVLELLVLLGQPELLEQLASKEQQAQLAFEAVQVLQDPKVQLDFLDLPVQLVLSGQLGAPAAKVILAQLERLANKELLVLLV
jgi:hypothetical protein